MKLETDKQLRKSRNEYYAAVKMNEDYHYILQ